MSLVTPTTQEISDNIIAQLEASLNQSIPLLPKSFLRVLAKAMAGTFVLLYKYGGFISLQTFVRTASDADTVINGVIVNPLVEWGRLIGVGDPAAATNAELTIDIAVITQTGSLPAGTQLVGADNGVVYLTLGAVALNAPTVPATVRAVPDQSGGSGAGAVGNLNNGAIMSFADPLANVNRDAVVTGQTVTGADRESTAAYRQRVIDRFQKRPQGGALADYESWGEEPAGILNIYPYTSDCPGQVDLYVEATPESSGDPDGIPTPAQLQEVLDSVELDQAGKATRRPATALVNTFPIRRTIFDVRITALTVDNLGDVQIDIERALTEYFLSREPFIHGLSVPPRRDNVTSAEVGGTIVDIVSAAGGIFSDSFMSTGGVELTAYTLGAGEKAKLGSVIYV